MTRVCRSDAHASKTKRRKRGGRSNPQRKKSLLIVSILLGMFTCAILVSTIVFWLLPLLDRSGDRSPVWEEARVRVVSQFVSPTEDHAIDLVKRALAARQEEHIEPLFRLGSSSPSEVVAFLIEMEKAKGPPKRFDWMSSIDSGGILLEGVLVTYPGAGAAVGRLALLTPDENGSWKLDFEAFARVVEPSWQEILSNNAEQAVVRVLIGSDVYYNGPFSDDKEWVCYGLTSPDMDETLHGYCKVGSAEAEALEKLFAEGNRMSRASLEITRVPDADRRQFEITRLLAGDWVVP